MYAPVGNGLSNHHHHHHPHHTSLLSSWWLHPPAGGAVGHECDREGNSIVEGGSERGGGEAYGHGPRGGIMDSHQQQFCLKWNSFGNNLATAFAELFKNESLTDVTLFCEGISFKAHRLILAACSKHFQELFEGLREQSGNLVVILDGTSAHHMASLLEFMYRGEVHVSQDALSSFLKAAEFLQVKGLSIEHEKLAVAQTQAAENSNATGQDGENNNNNNNNVGGGCSGNGTSAGSGASSNGCASNGSGHNEADGRSPDHRGLKRRAPTPDPPSSPAPGFTLPGIYVGNSHYLQDSPQKRLMSPALIESSSRAMLSRLNRSSCAARAVSSSSSRSPSDASAAAAADGVGGGGQASPGHGGNSQHGCNSGGRASVLRDGAAFRPASAPHPLLLENHLYQPFGHPADTPTHPHTAPHTPTELERELKRECSEERERNGDCKENVAEDLRIKQEPEERSRTHKLVERLSEEIYSGSRGYDGVGYGNSTDHERKHSQQSQHQSAQCNSASSPGMASLPPAHPPTPDLSPAPTPPALWNSRQMKPSQISTPDGKKLQCPYCERLYGYETNLRAHIRQRHQGIRVPCPHCPRTFTRNNTVRRHIAREHPHAYKQQLNISAAALAEGQQ